MAKLTARTLHVICLLVISLITLAASQTNIFANCDNSYNLNQGLTILQSPYYPNNYPPKSACRYRFTAPAGYNIVANCTINLPTSGSSCSSEIFYVSTEGDAEFDDIIGTCGSGTFTKESLFQDLSMAYVSYGLGGVFRCELLVKQQPCDCGWSMSSRIVNGQAAGPNEYPHAVALKDVSSSTPFYCGGAIISAWYIITAAHCAVIQRNVQYIRALVGRNQLSGDSKYADEYGVSRITIHPNYDPDNLYNDIALMKTNRFIHFSRGVAPICLPSFNNRYGSFAYHDVDVIGYGTTSFGGPMAPSLQKATLSVVTNEACQQAYHNLANIDATQMCTCDLTSSAKDSCQYDSGGPVIFRSNRMFLVGVISYGIACGSGANPVGVNARITDKLYWIYANSEYTTCPMTM